MKEQSADAHIPHCPMCGLPMNIARIMPALPAASGQTVDNYVYGCVQGHELIKRVERNERPRIRSAYPAPFPVVRG
jgi:hypothetical protein